MRTIDVKITGSFVDVQDLMEYIERRFFSGDIDSFHVKEGKDQRIGIDISKDYKVETPGIKSFEIITSMDKRKREIIVFDEPIEFEQITIGSKNNEGY